MILSRIRSMGAGLLRGIAAASAGLVLSVRAEESLLSERDFLRPLPTVFSAARLPQAPEDAPGIVTVLDRETIRASGARNLADLFRLVPGFAVGYARGGQPVVAYHGLSGAITQRMQVLLDGRSLYAPYLFGGIDWNSLPVGLDDIERIEVMRGSNSASYGANAFLGVANIVTRTAAQSVGAHFAAGGGSNGMRDVALRLGAAAGGVHWRATAGERGDDGLAGLFDAHRTRYASLRADWRPDARDELDVQFGATETRNGLGIPGRAADPARDEDTSTHFLQVRWRRAVAVDHEFSFAWSTTEDVGEDVYFIPVTATSGLVVDYGRRARRDHLEYEHFMRLTPGLRAIWGAEYKRDALWAPQLFDTRAELETDALRAYASFEYRPAPTLTVNAGGLVERNALAGTQMAPRLALNWKPAPGRMLGLGYSRSFRMPSLFEQRSDWRFVYEGQTIDIRYLSRGGLQAERVTAFELTYRDKWPSVRLEVDARAFSERASALITQQKYSLPPGEEFAPDSGAYDLRNDGTARLKGIEHQWRWRPKPALMFVFGHYATRRSASAEYLAEASPAWGAHALARAEIDASRSLSFAHYWQAPLRWIGEASGQPASRRLDVRFDRSFRLGPTRMTLSLIGRNVLGRRVEFRAGQWDEPAWWLGCAVDY